MYALINMFMEVVITAKEKGGLEGVSSDARDEVVEVTYSETTVFPNPTKAELHEVGGEGRCWDIEPLRNPWTKAVK